MHFMGMGQPDWREIVRALGPALFRYFRGSFGEATAADLVQETLIRMVRKHEAGEFDESRGSMKSYAYGIARFVRLEELKRNNLPAFQLVVNDEIEPRMSGAYAVHTHESDPVSHLRWAISQLKSVEQEIILLSIDAEQTLEDIATTLALPVGTVKSHVHRAKVRLRELMEVNV